MQKENFIQVNDFDLVNTLECGQFFRFKKINDWYFVNSRNKLFKLKQENNKLYYKFTPNQNLTTKQKQEAFLKEFFNLNQDLKQIHKQISKDNNLKKAISMYPGLRLIKQDPWECTISYICSSAANIPKIQMNIELLSKEFGKKIELDDFHSFTFPEPGTINNFKKIKACKTGFRAEFIFEANEKLKNVQNLKDLDYETAKKELIKVKGIGNKVADCICLFSLDKKQAFPVDTWVTKIMNLLYTKNEKNKAKISQFAQNYFGEYAGYAQQYLFHFIRNSK